MNLYLPKGVLNVVSNDESLDNFIVQYPERASSLVKYWAPASLGNTSSNARGGYWGLKIALLRSLGSRQTRIFPVSGFSTITRELTHSVGSVTLHITSSFSIRSSSALSLSCSASGTRRGGVLLGVHQGLCISYIHLGKVQFPQTHPYTHQVSAACQKVVAPVAYLPAAC